MSPANSKSLLMVRPNNNRGRVDSRHLLTTGAGVLHHSSRTRHSMPLVSIRDVPSTRIRSRSVFEIS